MGLTVPIIWTAIGMTAGLTAVLLYLGLFQNRSRGRPRCPKCWYNMTGAPSLVCPECGHDARRQSRLFRTRRRRWAVMAAGLLAACCYYSWLVRIRVVWLHEPVPIAVRPTGYLLATLPHAQGAQFGFVTKRIRRFGIWPWEERLLLLGAKSALSAFGTPQPPWEAVYLLSTAANTSDWCLDRLTEMSHDSNTYVSTWALEQSAPFVRRLTDEQIISLVNSAMSHPTEPYLHIPEQILLEMVRRNRPAFREQIARWAAAPPEHRMLKIRTNLEILTALRRMQGRTDPLQFFITGPRVIQCTTEDLPTIQVGVRNVDERREAIGFLEGGSNDTIRRDYCLFDVRDAQGRQQALRGAKGYSTRPTVLGVMLEFGQSVEHKLDLDNHVQPLRPGRYRVTALYHNTYRIAGHNDVSNLIVFSSQPFDLIVKPAGADSGPASQPR